MTLYDIVNTYPGNAEMKKLMDSNKVITSHLLSKNYIDGCESLGIKGTHEYRTIETLKTVGFGKRIKESAIYSQGKIVYMTTTALRVVFDAEDNLITIVPQSAAHIRKLFPAFAATTRGKQLCKWATEHNGYNIWDW